MAAKKKDERQISLIDGGKRKSRGDEDRSVPKKEVPEGEVEKVHQYNGLTIEQLEHRFIGLAAEFEGAWKSGQWNGASYLTFEMDCLDKMAEVTRRIKEMSMEYRFRCSLSIDVIGTEGLYKMRATLPGKITNNKFA